MTKQSPKERILEIACTLFYTQGYNVTGINQILAESKVAKASLYKHFGSKEELGIEYVQKVREEWFKGFELHLSKIENARQKILAAFDFLEINMRLNSFRGCRFLNLLTEIDDQSDLMRAQIIVHKTKLRSIFKSLVKQHTLNEGEPTLPNADDTIYLLFEAAIVESKVYRDVWPIVAAKKTVSNILKLTT